MLPVYCMTGCDTVSSFHGHGKKSVFRIMSNRQKSIKGCQVLDASITFLKRKLLQQWHLSVRYMEVHRQCH